MRQMFLLVRHKLLLVRPNYSNPHFLVRELKTIKFHSGVNLVIRLSGPNWLSSLNVLFQGVCVPARTIPRDDTDTSGIRILRN